MEAFNGSERYIFLSKIIIRKRKAHEPHGDYIQQLNQVMIEMEKEYGYQLASSIFHGLDKIVDEDIKSPET